LVKPPADSHAGIRNNTYSSSKGSAMKVSAIETCTIGVSDLEHSLELFRDVLRLAVERAGELSPALLAAWGLPPGVTARYAELSAGGYPLGRLRLVQFAPRPTTRVRNDHAGDGGDSATDVGPKAIDFYVAEPILPRVREIEAAGYAFRSPPIRHVIADTESEECLFSGPDGVPVLIMVGHRHSEQMLRPGCLAGPYSEIATISVVAEDLSASARFYRDLLGFELRVDAETGSEHRRGVNDLTGVASDTRIHFCVYGAPGEASGKILLVNFYERTGRRLRGRMRPGHLGFSLMTHLVDDLAELHGRMVDAGCKVLTPPTTVDYAGRPLRIMLVEGPNEECFEFVQEKPA
jgi:catechol 2,3-dioxygenase-like lactoylglutathione lyase family enzyme